VFTDTISGIDSQGYVLSYAPSVGNLFISVFINGIFVNADVDATDGNSVKLKGGLFVGPGDRVTVITDVAADVANTWSQAQADARFARNANNLSDLADKDAALTNLGGTTIGKGVFKAGDAPTGRAALGIKPMQMFLGASPPAENALPTTMTNYVSVDFTPTTTKAFFNFTMSFDGAAAAVGIYCYAAVYLYSMANGSLFSQSGEFILTIPAAGYHHMGGAHFYDGLGIGTPYRAWVMARVNVLTSPVYPRVGKIWGFTHE